MQVNRSGGGHEPEQRRTEEPTAGTDDSLHELFAGPQSRQRRDDHGGTDLRDHRSAKLEGLARVSLGDNPRKTSRSQIRRLTVSTVLLVAVTAIGFGYLSIQTGSSIAAFAAGLLAGISGIVFGFGEIAGVLAPTG